MIRGDFFTLTERLARERVTTRDQLLGWSRGCVALPEGDTEETRDCVIKNDVFICIKRGWR